MAACPKGLSRYSGIDRKEPELYVSPVLLICRSISEEARMIHRQNVHFYLPSPLLIPMLQKLSFKRLNLITSIGICCETRPRIDTSAEVVHGERVMASWSAQQMAGYVSRQLRKFYEQVAITKSDIGTVHYWYGKRKEFYVGAEFSNTEVNGSHLVKKWAIEREETGKAAADTDEV